jgi:hypothetical protein
LSEEEKKQRDRLKYYGYFTKHKHSVEHAETPKLIKFKSSNTTESVFNGVFYNLDAEVKGQYIYEDPKELYEFYEQIGEGAFSQVFKAKFIGTGEMMAVKILKEERATQSVIEHNK